MERYTLTFNANMKPIDLYKTNQTIFDYSKLSIEGVNYAQKHLKEYIFEDWMQALKFKNALRKNGVNIRF